MSRSIFVLLAALALGACIAGDGLFGDSQPGKGATAGSGAAGGAGVGVGGSGTSGPGSTSASSSAVSASGGAGGAGGCHWSDPDPCGNGFYCNAPGCGDGVCEPVGEVVDTDRNPVCGCDGVNYWNEATAAFHGMAVSSGGTCDDAHTCGGFPEELCPSAGHHCARLRDSGAQCVEVMGVCWGMPKECDNDDDVGWRPCFQGWEPCVSECQAMISEQGHEPARCN
jgi:hypothetical protein